MNFRSQHCDFSTRLLRISRNREQDHLISLSSNRPHQAMIAAVVVLALLSALVATEPDQNRDPE